MSIYSPKPRFRIYTSSLSYISIFKDVIYRRVNKGDECKEFEKEIQKRFSVECSICTPQGRVGIYLAVKAAIKPGQKVILSPYTIADVINMVICAGGIPVFADIERETCNIDPKEIEKLIDDDTGAVLVTHIHGLVCPLDKIIKICKPRAIPIIEDAAQAFGAKFNAKYVGTVGDIGVYSFGIYKNLTSFYGGLVVTSHFNIQHVIQDEISLWPYSELKWMIKRVLSGFIKDFSTSSPLFQILISPIFRFGHLHKIRSINKFVETELDLSRKEKIPDSYLRKMTPMQARLLLLKINNVSEDNAKRIQHAKIYKEGLKQLNELILPPFRDDGSHIYTYYPIQYKNRDELIRFMMKNHRDIGPQHLKNCADLPAFKNYYKDCPNCRETANEVILLPTYPRYNQKEIEKNIRVIHAFFGK